MKRLIASLTLCTCLLLPGLALGQGVPVIPTIPATGVPQVDNAAGQLNNAAGQINNATQDPGGTAANIANSIVPGSGTFAQTILNAAQGGPVGALIAPLLGGLESKLLDMVLENDKLKQRVTTLEADNTKTMINVQHLQQQVSDLAQANQSMAAANEAMRAELAAALATMEQQTTSLQQRVAELERTKGTITAPFKVVAKDGFTLLKVDEVSTQFAYPGGGTAGFLLQAGMTPQFYINGDNNGVTLDGGATPRIALLQGGNAVFEASYKAGQGVRVTGQSDTGAFELAADSDLTGLLVKQGDAPVVGLGTYEGRTAALRVFAASGSTIAAMGENPAVPGTGIVYAGGSAGTAASLSADSDGSGRADIFAADGSAGASMIGKDRMVAAYNAAGNAVVTIGKSENSEGGNVTSRNPDGEGVFRAGFNGELGGGDACVYRAKRQNTFCLGIGLPGMGVGK